MKAKSIVIIWNLLVDIVCFFLLIHSFYIFYISGLLTKETLKCSLFVWIVLVVIIILDARRSYF